MARRSTERIVTGHKAIDRKLAKLDRKVANKAARAGLSKAVRIVVKAIKAEVPSEAKDVKSAIGGTVKKDRGHVTQAKAGAAVGKKAREGKPRGGKKGVGISAANVHWWVMGTADRTRKNRGSTGQMPANGVVRRGYDKSAATAKRALEVEVKRRIQLEAAKG